MSKLAKLAPWITSLLLGSVSGQSAAQPGETTSAPIAVAPEDDTVNRGLQEVVVVTLEVKDHELKQIDAKVLFMPKGLATRVQLEGPVKVEALRRNKGGPGVEGTFFNVLTSSAPYEIPTVAEHKGFLKIVPRTITLSLPVSEPFDVLRVTVPTRLEPYNFQIGSTFRQFCTTHGSDEWCRPGKALE